MKKIISLFKRDYEGNRLVYNEIVPGAEWVQKGEGIATIKIDGTSCLLQDGNFYKRYDAKKGKAPPADFIPAQDPDPVTGHWPGWVLVGDSPSDKWHKEAAEKYLISGVISGLYLLPDGTYELIGPKVQGNPYHLDKHELVKHGAWVPNIEPPRDFDGLREWFRDHIVEGIVWHHPNGDMVKIKRRDFGMEWPVK